MNKCNFYWSNETTCVKHLLGMTDWLKSLTRGSHNVLIYSAGYYFYCCRLLIEKKIGKETKTGAKFVWGYQIREQLNRK